MERKTAMMIQELCTKLAKRELDAAIDCIGDPAAFNCRVGDAKVYAECVELIIRMTIAQSGSVQRLPTDSEISICILDLIEDEHAKAVYAEEHDSATVWSKAYIEWTKTILK